MEKNGELKQARVERMAVWVKHLCAHATQHSSCDGRENGLPTHILVVYGLYSDEFLRLVIWGVNESESKQRTTYSKIFDSILFSQFM